MSDCAREMTDTEKAKFITAILERGGYNMQQWERDYLIKVLKEKIDILPYSRKQGYQPTMEAIHNVPPSTGSSVQYQEKILGEWVKTKGDKIRESNEGLVEFLINDTDFQYDGVCSLCNKNNNGCCAGLICKDEVIKSVNIKDGGKDE